MASIHLPKSTGLLGLLALGMATSSFGQQMQTHGAVTQLSSPYQASQASAGLDFAHAHAMPLPDPGTRPPSEAQSLMQAPDVNLGSPGSSSGESGNGKQAPVRLSPEKDLKLGR